MLEGGFPESWLEARRLCPLHTCDDIRISPTAWCSRSCDAGVLASRPAPSGTIPIWRSLVLLKHETFFSPGLLSLLIGSQLNVASARRWGVFVRSGVSLVQGSAIRTSTIHRAKMLWLRQSVSCLWEGAVGCFLPVQHSPRFHGSDWP